MRRFLLFGKYGQLGWELHRSLLPLGEVQALDYPEIDLANPERLREIIRSSAPDVIVNATAYTAVDKAESERELAFAINAASPMVMAEEAKKIGAALIHYSTDYIFDGKKGAPYVETDVPNPLNVYGESKLEGERAIQAVDGTFLILRTAWVYSLHRDSFVTKVLQWARQNETLRIVDDQISNPTWARMLAQVTGYLLTNPRNDFVHWLAEHKGVYHLAGNGFTSRYGWAATILENYPDSDKRVTKELIPAPTTSFPTPAQRPLFSALDCNKIHLTFGLQLPDWKTSLLLALESLDTVSQGFERAG